jgi:dipeptidyl aminopeptidase/acylaminoacyl peptidase
MKTALTLLAAASALASAAQAQDAFEIEDLFRLQAVGGVAVSPGGESVAYSLYRARNVVADEEDGTSLGTVRVMREGRDQVFVPEDVSARGVRFLDDDTLLYVASHDGGDAIFRMPLSGGAPEVMFAAEDGIGAYDLSANGRVLFFTAREGSEESSEALKERGFDARVVDEDIPYSRLYRVDLSEAEPAARRLDVEGSVSAVASSPDGRLVAIAVADTPTVEDDIINRRIEVLDARTGRTRVAALTEGKVGSFAFSPDGRRLGLLAGTSRYDSSAHTVAVLDLSSGELDFLTGEDEADEVDFVWTGPEAMRVLAHRGVGTRHYTLSVDGRVSDETEHEGFVVTDIEGGGRTLAAIGSAPTHPNALFTAEGGGALAKRTDHNEWLSGLRLGEQRVVTYEAEDGVRIEGVLIEPVAQRRRARGGGPMITVVHGGPESHYLNGWLTGYSAPGQFAAGDGYAVFYPNYRGSTGRGQAFAALDQQDPPAAEFDDVVAGVRHLVDQGIADAEKVGITGGSYGGYASAWGATKQTETFAAAVVFVALTDLTSFMGTTDIPEEMIDSHFRMTPEDEPETYRAQSPVTHAPGSRTPTLILHGDADPRVDPSQSLQLYRTMKRTTDTPVRLVLYPGEGHGNRRAASQFDYAHRAMRWFDTFLKGGRGAEVPPRTLPAVEALAGEPGQGAD